jgi:5'-3' exoribonuclease 2
MGVPTFFKWVCTRYPKVIKDAVEKSCVEVDGRDVPVDYEEPNPNGIEFDNLYLDMNGIIHPCCHPEDGLMPESEDVMYTNIVNYTDRLIRILRPRKLLYIAIDGVAPRAKMNQQRARRYRAAQEALEQAREEAKILNQFEKLGKALPNVRQLWDSNVITPGTPFLERIGHLLRWYVADRMTNDPLWKVLGFRVITSDAHAPGEGEHKIMDFIRKQRMQPAFNPNTTHCLYGADADLIMLGLATHEVSFYIIREVVIHIEEQRCYLCNKSGHLPADCTGAADELGEDESTEAPEESESLTLKKPFQIISIAILREYLEHQFSRFADSLPFSFDFERCIDDFVFICFFVGNDFLPHLPSLSIREGSIDQMMILYLEILPTLGDYLTDAGTVNLPQVDVFLEYLGKLEDEVFKQRLEREDRFRSQRAQGRTMQGYGSQAADAAAAKKRKIPQDANLVQARKLLSSLTSSLTVVKKPIGGSIDTEVFQEQTSAIVIEDVPVTRQEVMASTDEFYDQVRHKLRDKQDLGDAFPDRIRLGEGSDFSWKQRYYFNKFKVRQEDIPDFVMRIRQAYVEGICWVLGYYYQGVPSWTWYYPYHYAPFASDLVGCDSLRCNQAAYFTKGEPFQPFYQLISVLPPKSANPAGLPSGMVELMTSPSSEIIDFFPEDFALDLNGKKFLWQAVVLLPFIKEERLLSVLGDYFRSHPLTEEENVRNSLNRHELVVPARDCLAPQLEDLERKAEGATTQLADMPYTDARGHGTTLFGRIYNSSSTGKKSVIRTMIASESDVENPACVSAEIEDPHPHPSRPQHMCQLLPGSNPNPPVLDISDHIEATQLKGFGGEPARRMILNVLQQKLEFNTQAQVTRSFGPSELTGPPAPRPNYM